MKKSLETLRREIDEIDGRIVDLLNRRAECAVEIGRIKESNGDRLYVPSREREVLSRVIARNKGPLSHAAICSIYGEIMASALALEHHDTVIAGGAPEADLVAAANFVAGHNVDIHCRAEPDAMFKAFRDAPDALLVMSDAWFREHADAIVEAAGDVRWRGIWTVPSGDGTGVRYHVFDKASADGQASLPPSLCCLVELKAGGIPKTLDWLGDVPVRCAGLTPLKSSGETGLLRIKLEMENSTNIKELASSLGDRCMAAWLVE